MPNSTNFIQIMWEIYVTFMNIVTEIIILLPKIMWNMLQIMFIYFSKFCDSFVKFIFSNKKSRKKK